jgi:antitoxin component HigA of HigAB toxin-antitoxin module
MEEPLATELSQAQQKILDDPEAALTAEEALELSRTRTISREAKAYRMRLRTAEAEVERLKRQTDQYAAAISTLTALIATWERISKDWQ